MQNLKAQEIYEKHLFHNQIMHNFLEVKYKIIPVTIKKAFIKANLEN